MVVISRFELALRISDTPIQPSLQKLAKVVNLQDRGFRISDTAIQISLYKSAEIEKNYRIEALEGSEFLTPL